MAEVMASPVMNKNAAKTILSVHRVEKTFGNKDLAARALNGVSFDIQSGEFVAIMGPSGSGKTTLLNCVATIDRVSAGQILLDGQNITQMNKRSLAKFRRDELGFIFQDFNLIDTLTGFENIAMALTIKGVKPADISGRVRTIADTLGVTRVLTRYPHQMSGGEKQRIAAARAVISDPKLVLADEPTGALDSRSSAVMLEVLETMNTRFGATIMMVTHDSYAASFSSRVLFLRDGQLFNEIRRGTLTHEQFFARIMEVVSFLGGEAAPKNVVAAEVAQAEGVPLQSQPAQHAAPTGAPVIVD